MDGEKERTEAKEEEKEEEKDDDDDDEKLHHSSAATSSLDHQDLPIMHWEDLSQRIAELEKQEQERSKRGTLTSEDVQGQWRSLWEDEDIRRCRVTVVSPRFHNHRNLQLCFINNSDSDDEDEDRKVPAKTKVAVGTGHNSCHAAGLKQEVAAALRLLRDKLLAEQMEKTRLDSSSCVSRRKHLDRLQLQQNSLQQLDGLRASLQEEVHALSAELVAQLLVRDQLRTKQDAMLLDVQDLT